MESPFLNPSNGSEVKTKNMGDGMRVQAGGFSVYAESLCQWSILLIDKILHHETDLEIKKHDTDAAGYTDQVFGLSHIFGFRFAPGIWNTGDAHFFSPRSA